MRVCMVISNPLPPREGMGFYVWNLARYLQDHGHQVQVITRGQRSKPYQETVDGIPIWRPHFWMVYPLHVYLHQPFVQRLIRQMEPQVDLFHFHTPLPPPVQSKRPLLLTVHSLMIPDARARKVEGFYDLLTKLQAPVCNQIEKQLLRASQEVTAVSPPVAEAVQRLVPPGRGQVEVMWNGVDTRQFSPQPGTAQPNQLLFVGRLAPGKGLQDLIEAFQQVKERFPHLQLAIAGDGPQRAALESLIEGKGLQHSVRLMGHVGSRDTLCGLYRRAWALILPSHHESLPGVILEAMACGTPVIATRVGGIAGVIQDGVNGLLVPASAPGQLAEAICRLVQDRDLRQALSLAGRQTIEKRFSWQVVGGNYLHRYQLMLPGAC